MRILLLEDEPLAAKRTQQYIERYGRGLTVAAWHQSVGDAVTWLDGNPEPEAIISDIELLDGNVFGLFEQRTVSAPVVFATAYDQFLLKAFETNGVGYLLKPYTYEAFAAAIDKVRRLRPTVRQDGGQVTGATLAALRAALQQPQHDYRERFTVRRSSGISLLAVADVALLLSEDKVTFAVDAHGKRHPLSQTLNALEAELDPRVWFRANRAEMVQMGFVERLENYGRDRLAIHLRGTKEVVVASRERTPGLRKWVEG